MALTIIGYYLHLYSISIYLIGRCNACQMVILFVLLFFFGQAPLHWECWYCPPQVPDFFFHLLCYCLFESPLTLHTVYCFLV